MTDTELKQFAKDYSLQPLYLEEGRWVLIDAHYINADGCELIAGHKTFFDLYSLARKNGLTLRVVEITDGSARHTNYVPFDRLFVDNVVRGYFDEEYEVVDFKEIYLECSKEKYIADKIRQGASPDELSKHIDDTKAIVKMFDEKSLGYGTPLSLVMDKANTEHHLVRHSETFVNFKDVALAIALMPISEEHTRTAIRLIEQGIPVLCVPGMLPEDVVKISDKEFNEKYKLRSFGDGDGENLCYGPFVVLDGDDEPGYAFREQRDKDMWFWCSGSHNNIDFVSDVDETSIDDLLIQDLNVSHWLPIPRTKSDKCGNLLMT